MRPRSGKRGYEPYLYLTIYLGPVYCQNTTGFKAWVEDASQPSSPNLTFPVAPSSFNALLT